MSVNPVKVQPWLACIVIVCIGISYFTFLYKSWQAYQEDRLERDSKLNEILDRIPKPTIPNES